MSMESIRRTRGVPAKRGMTIWHRGVRGTIKSARGGYLKILLENERYSKSFHPTWRLDYFDNDGDLLYSSAEREHIMLSKVEIFVDSSPLSRRRYVFSVLDMDLLLEVDSIQERATKRHKWVSTKRWVRLDQRDSSMSYEEPPIGIVSEALESARALITYKQPKIRTR